MFSDDVSAIDHVWRRQPLDPRLEFYGILKSRTYLDYQSL